MSLNPLGRPATTPVVTVIAGAVPFAVVFDHHGNLAVAEAGTNAVETFRVGSDGTLTSLGSVGTGQAATCWIVRDGSLLFTSNAGSADHSGIRIGAHESLTLLGQTATDAGTVEAAVSDGGRFLYV